MRLVRAGRLCHAAPVDEISRQDHLRARRRNMLVAVVMLAPFTALDLLLPNGATVAAAGAGWCLCILLGALLQRAGAPWVRGGGIGLATLGGAAAIAVKCQATGGPASLFFPLFMALPLLVLTLGPDLPVAMAATGVATTLAGAAVQQAWGLPAVEIGYWLVLSTGVVGLGLVGAHLQRRQGHALAAERTRAAAAEAAAAEGLRRAELERYAEVGRLAAALSHELNNPLASVAANLRWLTGPDAADPAERGAALEDAKEAAQRLAEVVQRIRSLAHASDEDLALAAGAGPGRERAG